MKKKLLLLIGLIASLFAFNPRLSAQVTTSAITGKVSDSKKQAIPGITVIAVHVPTGTKYGAVSNIDGRYNLSNLAPGGPYTITAHGVGVTDKVVSDIYLSLGITSAQNFEMSDASTNLGTVNITAAKNVKTGASTNVKEQLNTLPSISRSLSDFTRLSPQNTNNSFSGSNFRYNNLTLDGAINNDAIGFSPSLGGQDRTGGTPGSSTRSNPFSLDAIQEVQVSVAPFDVTVGNFTGGSVNAVTRSGTNEVHGSVYSYGSNASMVGKSVDSNKAMPSAFHDLQYGARVGLPIIKNKVFLFVNGEVDRHQEPVFYMAGHDGSFMTSALAKQISDSMKSKTFIAGAPYNIGAYDTYNNFANSQKFFVRLDINLSDKHQLAIRNNMNVSEASNLDNSLNQFAFGSQDFVQHNVLNSTVAELKSRFNNNLSNSLILGYTTMHDYRDPTLSILPQIQITNGTGTILLGTNREAGIFNMYQKNFEVTDNLKFYWKNHSFTVGTHDEFYKIDYGFINSWNGRYDYSSPANFFANTPSRMRAFYNLTDNSHDYNYSNPSASFNIDMLSAYVQDDWNVKDNFKITPGVRIDYTYIPTGPSWADTSAKFGLNNAPNNPHLSGTYSNTDYKNIKNTLFAQAIVSPRIGFNWDALKNGKFVVRGGTGVFQGRMPFAWLGYSYYNNGTNFGAFDYKPAKPGVVKIPTNQDTLAQFGGKDLPGASPRREIDLIDNHFKMPRVWRSNLAVDFNVYGYKFTLEGTYTKTMYDVQFQNINLKDTVTYALYDVNHLQPIYLSTGASGQRVNANYSNAYLLTNTTQGWRYTGTFAVSKRYKFGLDVSASYTYGQSKDIWNGIRNSPESNWQLNQALTSNNPSLAYSNFDIRHHFIVTVGYNKKWNNFTTTHASIVFTAQSGTPFTYVILNNNLTKSGQQVDLAYIPAKMGEIWLDTTGASKDASKTEAAQWAKLDAFLSGTKYLKDSRGQFTERNGARTPWNTRGDFRLMQDFNFKVGSMTHTLSISVDIINLTNLISKDLGRYYYVPNTLNSSVGFGLSATGNFLKGTSNAYSKGTPIYTWSAPTTAPYSIDQLASRWQGQLGIRYTF